MQMPTFDANQLNAFLRHLYTAVGSATAVLLFVGLSQGDITALGAAIKQVGDGLSSVFAGVAALVPLASGIYASFKASRISRMKSFDKDPQISGVQTVPGTEAAKEASTIAGTKVT